MSQLGLTYKTWIMRPESPHKNEMKSKQIIKLKLQSIQCYIMKLKKNFGKNLS